MTRLALIPSPFVGAVAWQTVADVLPNAIAADYGRAPNCASCILLDGYNMFTSEIASAKQADQTDDDQV